MKNYADTLGISLEDFINQYVLNKNITFTVCDQLFVIQKMNGRTMKL